MVHSCAVYTERAETAAVSCGTSHAGAVSAQLRWIFITRYKKLFTHAESHSGSGSLLESREQRYMKAIILLIIIIIMIINKGNNSRSLKGHSHHTSVREKHFCKSFKRVGAATRLSVGGAFSLSLGETH